MADDNLTQDGRPLSLTTPLGKDKLLITRFSGREGVSQLFRFTAEAIAPKKFPMPDFGQLLGKLVTVKLALTSGERFFNGLCHRVRQGESSDQFTAFSLDIVPAVWLLTKKAQSRIFKQGSTVKQILKDVLTGVQHLTVQDKTKGEYLPRDYCVQYRETDFNFASRLMEEEGIYYFFTHAAQGHEMVLADKPGDHPALGTFVYKNVSPGEKLSDDLIYDWAKSQEITSGKVLLWDHCFEIPHKHLEATKAIPATITVGGVPHKLTVGDVGKLEVYDFPGEYAQRFDGISPGGGDRKSDLDNIAKDNKRTVEIRAEQEAVTSVVITGAGNCRAMISGHKFTLEAGDDHAKLSKAAGTYVLTEVVHAAQQSDYRSGGGGFSYSNSFRAIPFELPYRPLRLTPKPVVPGTQTAVVVGPNENEEIHTDKYGRVKVQFHWDRDGKYNAENACWIRVGTTSAGRQWGWLSIPRVGQEVIVDFLEGDPDQPIIVGSVYNADQMPTYKLPDERTKSYIRTNSSPGGDGYNEIRFEDKSNKEQIFIHAQRNLDLRVRNDRMERIIGNSHLIVGWEKDGKKGGDLREMVYQDHHVTIHRDEQQHVHGNLKLMVGHGKAKDDFGNVDIVVEKVHKLLIGKDSHEHVMGENFLKVDKAQSVIIEGESKTKIGKDLSTEVGGALKTKAGGVMSLTAGGIQMKSGGDQALEAKTIHLKAGMTAVIEAGMQLTLKVGGNFIDIGPAGVTIMGTLVKINSGGAPGSGAGAQPASPAAPTAAQDAAKAAPTEPAVADDSKTGKKSN